MKAIWMIRMCDMHLADKPSLFQYGSKFHSTTSLSNLISCRSLFIWNPNAAVQSDEMTKDTQQLPARSVFGLAGADPHYR